MLLPYFSNHRHSLELGLEFESLEDEDFGALCVYEVYLVHNGQREISFLEHFEIKRISKDLPIY